MGTFFREMTHYDQILQNEVFLPKRALFKNSAMSFQSDIGHKMTTDKFLFSANVVTKFSKYIRLNEIIFLLHISAILNAATSIVYKHSVHMFEIQFC